MASSYRSIISGQGLVGREEEIIGEAVHSNIPQISICEYLAWELVVVLMRLDACTFDGHGPILAEPVRQIRNNISIVWSSLPLFELKQKFGSSDHTLAVTFPLLLDFGSHRVVA